MYDHDLLIRQRNEVLELVKASGLDSFNFKWSRAESTKHRKISVPVLEYADGKYYFQFDLWENAAYSVFSPGLESIDQNHYPGAWSGQLKNVAEWLTYLKAELNEPDLWAEIEKYRVEDDADLLSKIANEPFSANQADQIQLGILKVRSYLEDFTKGNQSQSDFVNEQLDYLVDAAKRQGKRDWLHTSIGVIMTICTALTLAPEEAKNIWNILKTTLGGILQLPH